MTARACNECTLCCKLLPIRETNKPANTLCVYQRSGKGCTVYHGEKFPASCGMWSCIWLTGDDDLARPDRSHYVIDPAPDFIEVSGQCVPVVQIWIDPKYPHAHKDPKLRAWLARRFDDKGEVGLVRFDSMRAIALFPPAFPFSPPQGRWVEQGGAVTQKEHGAEERLRLLRLRR